MLINIDPLLNGDLLKALSDMGHGDELVIADAHFPSASLGVPVIRYDGVGTEPLLAAILRYFPLDGYADAAALSMQVVNEPQTQPVICKRYQNLVNSAAQGHKLTALERFSFYQRAKKAYAVIATGESAQYANLILKKGAISGSY